MVRPRQSSNLVFVHRKRTGEVEIRRADGFSRPKAPRTPIPIHLHYTSHDRSNFCRCPNPSRHKFSTAVVSHSTHLAANLTRYLDHHDLEASSTVHLHAYNQQRRDDWVRQGIRIANFHYATNKETSSAAARSQTTTAKAQCATTILSSFAPHIFYATKPR
jgi:hypothetical protein